MWFELLKAGEDLALLLNDLLTTFQGDQKLLKLNNTVVVEALGNLIISRIPRCPHFWLWRRLRRTWSQTYPSNLFLDFVNGHRSRINNHLCLFWFDF